ncbi:uncharacterized protein [Littorina saxatilis]|uniref:uncharacterized protein n=1 Tax=Littorina saxatilis TaxID=31220 RepID=UPI0038B53C35
MASTCVVHTLLYPLALLFVHVDARYYSSYSNSSGVDASTRIIIGLVGAGISLLLLIVIIVIWCVKKHNKDKQLVQPTPRPTDMHTTSGYDARTHYGKAPPAQTAYHM